MGVTCILVWMLMGYLLNEMSKKNGIVEIFHSSSPRVYSHDLHKEYTCKTGGGDDYCKTTGINLMGICDRPRNGALTWCKPEKGQESNRYSHSGPYGTDGDSYPSSYDEKDSLIIRELSESSVDVEMVTKTFYSCIIGDPLRYASSQYDDALDNSCGEEDFHNLVKQSGKFNKLEISKSLYFVSKWTPFDRFNEFMWKAFIPYLLPSFFFCLQASMEVTQESNSLMKDYLLSMGMSRLMYFLHHFIFHFLKSWIHVLVTSVMIGVVFSSGSIAAYFFLLFSLALAAWISIALLIGTVFKRPAVTVIISLILWVSMLLFDHFVGVKRTSGLSILVSLNPLHAVMLFIDGKREGDLRGFSLWFSEVKYVIPQGFYLFMLILNPIIYFFLAVGIDWLRSSYENPMALLRRGKTREVEESKRLLDGNMEKSETRSGVADVVIEGVHKIYSSGEHAVRGVNMTMRKGQVTALLGHNGAGKSTTFSMISGMAVPTKGRILVMGNESNADKQKLIGYCPQYNPIFPKLTVDEHLKFFARMKGVQEWQATAYRVLTCLGMAQVGHYRAIKLSGGMKRKLCMAIAMAADPPIVLLDEPTAGLDPGARRDFERLLMEWKKEHTILLTTHYTDEAELLADRIFIMARGKVFCSGSPQFLRKRFDSGYILSFAVGNDAVTEMASMEMVNLVKEFVPEVSVAKVRGKQFELKLSTDDSKRFVEMFRKIEEVGPSFGMQSYGLSLTKLEQVFLKVGEMTGTHDRKEEVQTALKELIQENGNRSLGIGKVVRQFGYTMMKRLLFDITHIPSLLLQLAFIFFLGWGLLSLTDIVSLFDTSGTIDLLHRSERYVIGVDESLPDIKSMQKIASQYGYLDIVAISGDMQEWYEKKMQNRPPVLGVLSRSENDWTIYIHPRDSPFVPTLEAIAARINNPNLKKLKFKATKLKDSSLRKTFENGGSGTEVISVFEILFLFFLALLMIIASPFMVIRPIAFLILERISNFAHQQRLTGANRAIILLATALYDFVLFILPLVAIIGGCLTSEFDHSVKHMAKIIILSLVAFFGGELLILNMYRVFASRAKGEISVIAILIGCSFGTLLFAAVMMAVGGNNFLYFPIFVVSPVVAALMWVIAMMQPDSPGKITGPLYFFLHFAALLGILVLVEMRRFMKRNKSCLVPPGDDLVLMVNNLQKWYGSKTVGKMAVNNISFGVRAHECFGVLGVNGAGKSSTFEILTGNTLPTGGSASVNGIDCGRAPTIGYCPQTDALLEHFSGRSTLIILAALHGYSDPRRVADIVITCVGMQEHADRATGRYSGGQRRKISVAASLLAQNSLIILDEPTAGIDPIARRDVWSVICALRENTNTAIVLTSHSMDEVEALVSNLIILSQGAIVVEGSPQMIKNQFGDHYNLNLVPEALMDVGGLTAQVQAVFPSANLYDSASLRNIKYRIPRLPSDVFSTLFEKAAAIADQIKATDFSFTQATLEDAFLLASALQPAPQPGPLGQPPFGQPPMGFAPIPQGPPMTGVTGTATATATATATISDPAAPAAAPSTDPAAPAAAAAPESAGAEPPTVTGTEAGTTAL